MSWFRHVPTTSTRSGNPNFTQEAREKRREELEQKRQESLNKRKKEKQLITLAVSTQASPVVSRAPTPPPSDEPVSLPVSPVRRMVDAAAVAAAHKAAELLKPFDEQDYPDDSDAWKKSISLKFDRHDPEFWFTNAEAEMETFGIFTQWSKRRALLGKDILPPDILDELKPLLRLTKAEAGATPYKDVKTEEMRLLRTTFR